jgi:amino acid permease
MSIVYFTLVAAILYLFSDWVLQRAEAAAGRRFKHRSLVFFCVLMGLAVASFSFIGQMTGATPGG